MFLSICPNDLLRMQLQYQISKKGTQLLALLRHILITIELVENLIFAFIKL